MNDTQVNDTQVICLGAPSCGSLTIGDVSSVASGDAEAEAHVRERSQRDHERCHRTALSSVDAVQTTYRTMLVIPLCTRIGLYVLKRTLHNVMAAQCCHDGRAVNVSHGINKHVHATATVHMLTDVFADGKGTSLHVSPETRRLCAPSPTDPRTALFTGMAASMPLRCCWCAAAEAR